LFSQDILMYFVGEARPYMPLAAAALGALAYYLTTHEARCLWTIRLLGWGSILLGVTMHPYFSMYWLAIFAFCLCLLVKEGKIVCSWVGMLRHVNFPLVTVGVGLYFTLAAATWGRTLAEFTLDPFHYLPKDKLFTTFFYGSHLTFITGRFVWAILLGLPLFCVFLWFRNGSNKLEVARLVAPMVLFLLSLGISILLSYISYTQGYWIFSRQWVASIAICPVAIIWMAAEVCKELEHFNKKVSLLFLSAFLVFFAFKSFDNVKYWHAKMQEYQTTTLPQLETIEPSSELCCINNEQWVNMANYNIMEKGKVWKVFRYYYENKK